MRRGIQLSGFGINCKTTLTKKLCERFPELFPVLSDSSVIGILHQKNWATYDPEDRLRFRYYALKYIEALVPNRLLLIDRGIVDQICFARLMGKGILPVMEGPEDEGFHTDFSFVEEYVPAESEFNFKKFFIMTTNQGLIDKVLSDETDNSIDKRSVFSKNVDQYLKNQEAFYEEFKGVVPDAELLEIGGETLKQVETELETLVDDLSEVVELLKKNLPK